MVMVSIAARLCALLHVLSVAPLLKGLPGHIFLDIFALLPGGGGALSSRGTGAILLIHILGDGSGDIATNLIRNVVAHFPWGGDVIADLESDKIYKK